MTDQFTIKKLERVLAELKSAKPDQLNITDLETMTPIQINEARHAGQLTDLMAGPTNKKEN